MERTDTDTIQIWETSEGQTALRQVAGIFENTLVMKTECSVATGTFFTRPIKQDSRNGIQQVEGELTDPDVITAKVELVAGDENARIPIGSIFRHLSQLGSRIRLSPPPKKATGQSSLWAELSVKATPLSLTRESALIKEIKQLDDLARTLQAEIPMFKTDADLQRLYKNFSEIIVPIIPLDDDSVTLDKSVRCWVKEVLSFLYAGASVALESPHDVVRDYAVSLMTKIHMESGGSIGRLTTPTINLKALPEVAAKAPGLIEAPAIRLSMGTSPYELGNEIKALLSTLRSANTPVLFTGRMEELQAVFSGGQGNISDPLYPIVCHVPPIEQEYLVRFSTADAGLSVGGLSQSSRVKISERILEQLADMPATRAQRLLPLLANRYVRQGSNNVKDIDDPSFIQRVSSLSETLGGLSPRPRVKRKSSVQHRFSGILSDPELTGYFRQHLLGQDNALEQLASRLMSESLTRPEHQPIRYCAQGTPGTGKSESAVLLSRRLNIPYVNIDAASMPDYHTAAAQLLGSGRGIVMSHQAGRLEQVARHHTGAVVEISDLDHAAANVRSVLADLFLQVLETGEAQSATGAMFSCANVIFAFTMNLPNGMDETIRKKIGFGHSPSRKDLNRDVSGEIREMLSSAFLSRVGTPVIFDPLDEASLARIMEKAVKKALVLAAKNLGLTGIEFDLSPDLGRHLIDHSTADITAFGARGLLEYGRQSAAQALVTLRTTNPLKSNMKLHAGLDEKGKIKVQPVTDNDK